MTEAPLDTFRASTWGWLRGTLAGLGTLLLFLLGLGLSVAAALLVPGPLAALPLLLCLVALVIVAAVGLKNLAATYQFTPERLIIRSGILNKAVDEIEMYRIKDVRLNYSLLNQWAGIGTLSVSSSDETTREGDLVIPHVPGAAARREHLRRLVDTARQNRRVREIDMAHDHI